MSKITTLGILAVLLTLAGCASNKIAVKNCERLENTFDMWVCEE